MTFPSEDRISSGLRTHLFIEQEPKLKNEKVISLAAKRFADQTLKTSEVKARSSSIIFELQITDSSSERGILGEFLAIALMSLVTSKE